MKVSTSEYHADEFVVSGPQESNLSAPSSPRTDSGIAESNNLFPFDFDEELPSPQEADSLIERFWRYSTASTPSDPQPTINPALLHSFDYFNRNNSLMEYDDVLRGGYLQLDTLLLPRNLGLHGLACRVFTVSNSVPSYLPFKHRPVGYRKELPDSANSAIEPLLYQ